MAILLEPLSFTASVLADADSVSSLIGGHSSGLPFIHFLIHMMVAIGGIGEGFVSSAEFWGFHGLLQLCEAAASNFRSQSEATGCMGCVKPSV